MGGAHETAEQDGVTSTVAGRISGGLRSGLKQKLLCFLVPVLTAVVLLYQVFTSLRIAVFHAATLSIIGVTLLLAAVAGAVAAFGPAVMRVGVLALSTLVFLDATFQLAGFFRKLQPERRHMATRDEQRIADLHRIQAALDRYAVEIGALPAPAEYGEAGGVPTFWMDSWDLSALDGDRDQVLFLDFLVEDGIVPVVPVDPVNATQSDDPREGKQYVYMIVPPDQPYAGGTCDAASNRWHYMLAITDLEEESTRPPRTQKGSGCGCLWRDEPNYFQAQFDYVVCGTFDGSPASRARAAETRAQRLDAKDAVVGRIHLPQDQRRVADLVQIRQWLDRYVKEVGPLPSPREYGEIDQSQQPGFWQHYWDVSSHDGDADGNPFLDFLVDSGITGSVPVDPENKSAEDGDPRHGRQYVYYLAAPDDTYAGGSCGSATNEWTWLLGITDLRSESARPPKRIAGSGCECLWRNQPDFFQTHFDYVTCGTFRR